MNLIHCIHELSGSSSGGLGCLSFICFLWGSGGCANGLISISGLSDCYELFSLN